jgi:hypothetical protein
MTRMANPNPAQIAEVSKEWRALIEPLLSIGERVATLVNDLDNPQLRHELYQFLYSQISMGYIGAGYSDPRYPEFWPFISNIFNTVDPNPDDMYYLTPIDGKGVYRMSGYRGTVNIIDISPSGGGRLFNGSGTWGQTYANYDANDLQIVDADGYFEVLLSNERPADHQGNWWYLNPQTTNINIRLISSNWAAIDARLAIERLDAPAIKPRPTPAEVEAKLKQVAVWAESWATASLEWIRGFKDIAPNTVALKQYNDKGAITVQTYIYGMFALEEDEALIYETEIPETYRYWAIQLNDDLFRSIDWVNRQSSLNDFSGKVDSDGKFRAVISARDPGVPNWLDNAGYRKGAMFGRWYKCSTNPHPTITKVMVADIRKHVPAETAFVSAQQREAAIRLRRKQYQLRRRW